MSSFFSTPKVTKRKAPADGRPNAKRPATQKSRNQDSKPSRAPRPARDEEISSDDSEDDGPRPDENEEEAGDESSDEEAETAAEKRLRLAERYLDNIREEVEEVGFDAEDIDRDLLAERLQEDVAESKGRAYRELANELDFSSSAYCQFRNNSEAVTGVAMSGCDSFVYTCSKDMYVTKWLLQGLPEQQYPKLGKKKSKKLAPPKRRPERILSIRGDSRKSKDPKFQGHTDEIVCIAVSSSGKHIATGSKDNKIVIWDSDLNVLKVFNQHRDSVLSLAFRRGENTLYSASKDRTIKIWNIDVLAYVETLFGHQDEIVSLAALSRETCFSVGARDRTARLWKIVDETQLVFRGGGAEKKRSTDAPKVLEGSMDKICCVDEDTFVTAGDNGNISLWVTHKKKPIHTYSYAHGFDERLKLSEYSAEKNPSPSSLPPPQPRMITALATIPYSDVILSGSYDGHVRAWKVEDKKKIVPLGTLKSSNHETNGTTPGLHLESGMNLDLPVLHIPSIPDTKPKEEPVVKGVINDITIMERGERGKDGICVVVAVGKEHRLGRWRTFKNGAKNGAVVFEVPRVKRNGLVKETADE